MSHGWRFPFGLSLQSGMRAAHLRRGDGASSSRIRRFAGVNLARTRRFRSKSMILCELRHRRSNRSGLRRGRLQTQGNKSPEKFLENIFHYAVMALT